MLRVAFSCHLVSLPGVGRAATNKSEVRAPCLIRSRVHYAAVAPFIMWCAAHIASLTVPVMVCAAWAKRLAALRASAATGAMSVILHKCDLPKTKVEQLNRCWFR